MPPWDSNDSTIDSTSWQRLGSERDANLSALFESYEVRAVGGQPSRMFEPGNMTLVHPRTMSQNNLQAMNFQQVYQSGRFYTHCAVQYASNNAGGDRPTDAVNYNRGQMYSMTSLLGPEHANQMMTTSTVVLRSTTAPIDLACMRSDHGMATRFPEFGADIEPLLVSMSIAMAAAEDGSSEELVPRDEDFNMGAQHDADLLMGAQVRAALPIRGAAAVRVNHPHHPFGTEYQARQNGGLEMEELTVSFRVRF